MRTPLDDRDVLVLDGGLATRLEDLGCDLSDELWSARLLMDDPDLIRRAHGDFFAAGADVAITASYQASVPALTRRGLSVGEAADLIRRSVALAAEARDDHGAGQVAASVGPYGAYLANGAEYAGAYDLDEDGLAAWHRDRWHILADSGADLLACETIPSYAEARALARLLAETPEVRAWVSFSCRDGGHISDGTPLADCAALFSGLDAVIAVGANCTAPRYIPSLIREAATSGTAVVVYPNSGETWDAENRRWTGWSDPVGFGAEARDWHAAGARLVGGCCRTTPDHIREIRAHLG
ncbi:homocysteine S-methyltransferase [Nocardiopsis gilva YIM 90087]|uniref:S-methylmethionine:homocysteine methyltransferase n=1 Tax=Nocardiopsis gilva YIM 90087 TaxID=1235441 RepID=A0A223S7Z1_9ACTN|nr:homocysteine S-methyltransferase [Nocardiopsis gilva]ASU84209.1 homocysteine S-methyltransferase [Nocardiopsis gilva YIM 90087]